MPHAARLRLPPPVGELRKWRVERMTLYKRPRAIFRRNGVTIIVVQTEGGEWRFDKLKGGRVLDSKTVRNLSDALLQLVTGKSS